MSKHINVNPDHYKVAGRERPGATVAKAPKHAHAVNDERLRQRWENKQKAKRTRA